MSVTKCFIWKLAAVFLLLLHSTVFCADNSVWVLPEGYKVDKDGEKIFVQDSMQKLPDLKQNNRIWKSANSTISLSSARGETVAFQVFIEGGKEGRQKVDINFDPL